MRSGHAMYVTCPKHRLCQTEIMFARCGQRSISCCSWATCATVCKETYMENSRKNDGEISLSDTFSRFRSWEIDEYGTFRHLRRIICCHLKFFLQLQYSSTTSAMSHLFSFPSTFLPSHWETLCSSAERVRHTLVLRRFNCQGGQPIGCYVTDGKL